MDSGATLSFIRIDVVKELKISVKPNNQLATLADQRTTISAVGEIDIQVTFHNIPMRLRALVVNHLQAPCLGGTNFHVENIVQTDIANRIVVVNGTSLHQSNFVPLNPSQVGRTDRMCSLNVYK